MSLCVVVSTVRVCSLSQTPCVFLFFRAAEAVITGRADNIITYHMNNISNGKGGKPQLSLVKEMFICRCYILAGIRLKVHNFKTLIHLFRLFRFRTISTDPTEMTPNNKAHHRNSHRHTPLTRTTKQPRKHRSRVSRSSLQGNRFILSRCLKGLKRPA